MTPNTIPKDTGGSFLISGVQGTRIDSPPPSRARLLPAHRDPDVDPRSRPASPRPAAAAAAAVAFPASAAGATGTAGRGSAAAAAAAAAAGLRRTRGRRLPRCAAGDERLG